MAYAVTEALTATIANGASLSGAINVFGRDIVAIVMPAGWTAAALTFQASVDGVNYFNVHSSGGTEQSYTVDASRYIPVQAGTFAGAQMVRLRSGTAGTPVNQGAQRDIGVVVCPLLAV